MRKLSSFFLVVLLIFSAVGCNFIDSFSSNDDDDITLSFDKTKTSVSMGAMEIISLSASKKQNSAKIEWSYDSNIIFAKTDNYSAVITGLEPGTTTVTAYCGSNSASCVVTVSEDSYAVIITNPYVYASSDYVTVKPNETVKISAALFGGTAADINGYTWSLDKSSVASLTTEGNYCWITGLNDGIAKLTVKHNKAAYGYSVIVNCSSDGTNLCYITTSENIVTINLSETDYADFAVDLMNSPFSDYASGFNFSVVDSTGALLSDDSPVSVSSAGSLNVSLSAKKTGECYVKCTHPSATYSLEILVRVIENAETAYIEPSETIATVSDAAYENISVSLMNYSGTVNPALFEWSFSDDADEYIEYDLLNGNDDASGDNINIKGKKTGSVKITVSYPGVSSRNIIVLARNIESEAADATCYITTSQNYIRMKAGGDAEQINISLKNASSSEIEDLRWTITNNASDGSTSKVINWKNGNGKAVYKSQGRAVLAENASAYAIIEPLQAGTAYIDISHPKAIYSTRITVVVTDTETIKEEKSYLNLSSSPIVYVKNGGKETVNISFSGSGNSDDIEWTKDGNVTIQGIGTECEIAAPASGSGRSQCSVTASHINADYPVKFTIICYDTEEESMQYAVKSIYSYQSHETLKTNQEIWLYIETQGLSESETPSVTWKITEGEKYVAISTENFNKTAVIKGLLPGKSVITVSCDGCDDVFFVIDVKDEGVIDEEKDCYLSTSSNVLYFSDINESLLFTVDLHNIDSVSYSLLEYSISNTDFDVSANGNSATVTSLSSEGNATLTITHPLSQNELTVYLKTGIQYEYVNEDFCYISLNQEVFELYAGQDEVSLVATLNHTEKSEDSSISKGFSFKCSDDSVAKISYVSYSNTCYIKPLKNGTAKITVTNPDSDLEKEAVVIVNNAPDSSAIPYITTSANVITMIQGNYSTATVSLMNSDSIDTSLWEWTSLDSRIADIVANNGTSAMICANAAGTVEIKVSHKECLYSLKIIVVVLDSSVVTSRPYISTSSNIITIQKGHSETLTAEMIGGSGASDSNYFRFQTSSSSTVLVTSSSNSAYIKALNTGMAYITIYNSRYSDSYSKTVLVVVEDTQKDGIYIKLSQSIVKIKPGTENLTNISATLVNGEATDGEDFIWWADDYNLVGITAVAEQCSIVPTGKSGTTKIHVKHAKSAKQADIVVMISDFDSFAFSTSAANINAEKLYFYPLQVPAMEEEYEVKYSSSNENVCIIKGSNAVAWVCGLSYGTASLTAKMVSSDGTVLATCEMLVTVTLTDPTMPVVSLGDSILTVEAGTSRVISGIISGDGIEETEKYNLKWSVKNKAKGISILDETADKTAYGSDVYVNFDLGGEYVLLCEHETSGAQAELYIIVEEKGEVGIELSSPFETVYKDDGSFTLTATLINATDADYKTIEWSAIKVGGQNIVAVTKAKGANCTVTPKAVGQTSVIAKLPNGKTAFCIVVVKANAEIHFDLGAVHVIPGYTETVRYTTNPENSSVNWYTQMTGGTESSFGSITNYFSIEDDTVKKQLHITGLKDYPSGVAGTVTASMVGASSANLPTLKVYVEYDVEVRLEDMQGNNLTLLKNNEPDTANVKTFNVVYYPTDLEIDIKKGDQIISCIPAEGNASIHSGIVKEAPEITIGDISKTLIIEEGIEKVRMTVSVVPHTECSFDISVSGTLPSDTSGSYSETKTFAYDAEYTNGYDIELVNMTQSGAFTEFKNNAKGNIDHLYLSDGEEAVFYLKIKNENAAGYILPLTKDNWTALSDTNDVIYSDDAQSKYTGSRADKAKVFFSNLGDNISNNTTASSNNGLIYFTEDRQSVSNTTVYHLGHAWDYYKDLPSEVTGDKWEEYRKEHAWDEDFISTLKNKGVDYWLVSAEIEYDGCYSFPHENSSTFSGYYWLRDWNTQIKDVTWKKKKKWWGTSDRWWWDNLTIYIGESYGTKELLTVEQNNDGHNGNLELDALDPYYKTCIPFVVSTEQLLNHNLIVIPSLYRKLRHKHDWNTGDSYYEEYLPKMVSPYITPTVLKCTKEEEDKTTDLGKGVLTIHYIDAHKNDKTKTLAVTVQKRLCEAYTNGNWTTENTSEGKHWRLSSNLFDTSTVGTAKPYLRVENRNISCSYKKVPVVSYSVNPSNSVIIVTIPQSEETGKLTLSGGYSSVSTDSSGATVYKITSHSSTNGNIATGSLNFSCNGSYNGTVTVASSQRGTSYISFDVSSEDCFVPVISKKVASNSSGNASKYSYIDAEKRLLVVGDGETVSGKIINTDTSSISTATYAYQPLSSSTSLSPDTKKDQKSKLQSELTNVSVAPDGSFTVCHTKDYGYFGSDQGTTDEFFSTTIYSMDATVSESEVSYETAYNSDGSIDTATTLANKTAAILDARRRKLNDLKSKYVYDNSGKEMSSYTASYCYKDHEYTEETVTYSLTPVGTIVIIPNGDTSDAQEIIVCVKITENPCAESSSYGYSVPSSYYLNYDILSEDVINAK